MSGLNPPWFLQQYRDTNGSVLSSGKLYFFVAGSTTLPKAVYSNFALTTPIVQPVILDGSGNAPEYFMEAGLYKVVVRASDDRLIATRDDVAGGGGSGSSIPMTATMEIESFPLAEGTTIVDDESRLWMPDGCFCWIFPSAHFSRLAYIKSAFPASSGFAVGKFSVWGMFEGGAFSIKLHEASLDDAEKIGYSAIDVDISPYQFIGIAMDPGTIGPGEHIKQLAQSFGPYSAGFWPQVFGFVGVHSHNTSFASWPVIKGATARYLLTKWIAAGVVNG